MRMYQYTLLKQDGTVEDLGVSKKKKFRELYKILQCNMIELIPTIYYENHGRCSMYGDEEGRFKAKNIRNPHFKVIKDAEGRDWDVVGDIIKERVYKGNK